MTGLSVHCSVDSPDGQSHCNAENRVEGLEKNEVLETLEVEGSGCEVDIRHSCDLSGSVDLQGVGEVDAVAGVEHTNKVVELEEESEGTLLKLVDH